MKHSKGTNKSRGAQLKDLAGDIESLAGWYRKFKPAVDTLHIDPQHYRYLTDGGDIPAGFVRDGSQVTYCGFRLRPARDAAI